MERSIHEPDAEGFIPGVYNYCDRRCERCRFVRRCRVGIIDVDDVGEAEDATGTGRAEDLRERMRKIMGLRPQDDEAGEGSEEDLGEDDDEEDAMDLDFPDLEEAPDPEEERRQAERRQRIKQHPLSNLGMTYMSMVGEWFDTNQALLLQHGVGLDQRSELELPVAMRTPEALVLNEACDELRWFKYMLHVKCQRAISSKTEDEEWMLEMGLDPLQSDANGTAKLCLEIVRRCKAAWTTVAELLPGAAGDIVLMQELLRRIEEQLDREFPDADRFIRPGFDAPTSIA